MGLFNKQRTDGATHDGQGEERRGMIDVVQYNGAADDLVWRFPYDNLSTKAHIVVQEGQEAVFSSGGQFADVFAPGTKVLSTNNLPILHRIVNLPFGGDSPFKATVTYVNTTMRVSKWGTQGMVAVKDYSLGDVGMLIKVGAHGNCTLRVANSTAFLREFVGTTHHLTASEFQGKFVEQISQYIKPVISRYFSERRTSVTEINNYLLEIADYMRGEMNTYFSRFGIEISDFGIAGINPDENDPNYQKVLAAQQEAASLDMRTDAEARRFAKFGTNYQQERQFDVMQSAASNPGTAGNTMGAGLGMGMGFGIGGVFGGQMQQMSSVMQAQGTVPPPMPTAVMYHACVNNAQQGPFDMMQMQHLVAQGLVNANTLVWKPGLATWVAAGTCPDLAPILSPQAPPVPPTPPMP